MKHRTIDWISTELNWMLNQQLIYYNELFTKCSINPNFIPLHHREHKINWQSFVEIIELLDEWTNKPIINQQKSNIKETYLSLKNSKFREPIWWILKRTKKIQAFLNSNTQINNDFTFKILTTISIFTILSWLLASGSN